MAGRKLQADCQPLKMHAVRDAERQGKGQPAVSRVVFRVDSSRSWSEMCFVSLQMWLDTLSNSNSTDNDYLLQFMKLVNEKNRRTNSLNFLNIPPSRITNLAFPQTSQIDKKDIQCSIYVLLGDLLAGGRSVDPSLGQVVQSAIVVFARRRAGRVFPRS